MKAEVTPNRSRPQFNMVGVFEPISRKVYGIYSDLSDQAILKLSNAQAQKLIHQKGRQDYNGIADFLANAPERSENNWAYLFYSGTWQTYRRAIRAKFDFYPRNLIEPKPNEENSY